MKIGEPVNYVEKQVDLGDSWFSVVDGVLEPGEMLLFIKDGFPRFADFLCPCGCKNPISIALKVPLEFEKMCEPGEAVLPRPEWHFSRGKENKITLIPAIRQHGGCRTHFSITDGQAILHGD